jgi:ABC-type antimicrobial peptide transport system permease subunit
LVIAAVGLYSMIAYDVAQRTRDIGVRIALGAPVTRIVRLVLAQGLGLVGVGVAVGMVAAIWAAPRFDPLLFGQSARNPGVLVVAAVTLLVVGAIAVVGPAIRAARVDPGITLRAD